MFSPVSPSYIAPRRRQLEMISGQHLSFEGKWLWCSPFSTLFKLTYSKIAHYVVHMHCDYDTRPRICCPFCSIWHGMICQEDCNNARPCMHAGKSPVSQPSRLVFISFPYSAKKKKKKKKKHEFITHTGFDHSTQAGKPTNPD